MRTLLIIGAGDVARRALPELVRHWRVLALCRSSAAAAELRRQGVTPIRGDLDHPASLRRLAGLADDLLLTAPPQETGRKDLRMRKLLSALAKGCRIPQRLVYISTSGVYGDAGGAWLNESARPRPRNDRAWRRLDAETQLRRFAAAHGSQLVVLRAPGIYADERLPLSRFATQAPLIVPEEDSWSNHIHADDLAAACVAALQQCRGGSRVYNACDDQPLQVSAWYRQLSATLTLPLPPLLPRDAVRSQLSAGLWSYLAESRRLDNRRLRSELLPRLRWPSTADYLAALAQAPERITAVLASTAKIR
ncbi:NAD-dependent dehydratase [Chromobacterium sp. LK1]|uniref:NAD-dependent epimerase/dehydratase family protein n=1 Tax=Chromobacterium sp. LK1 TaxID=1628193 RepID=UPI000652D1DA|nr:NAD-dependent epimerase/dehydratase family protein [Chromobacterium sp. LK1]KMN35915.1 NAD-dependent dehydratase [Chromobacterium sp. LK1]